MEYLPRSSTKCKLGISIGWRVSKPAKLCHVFPVFAADWSALATEKGGIGPGISSHNWHIVFLEGNLGTTLIS